MQENEKVERISALAVFESFLQQDCLLRDLHNMKAPFPYGKTVVLAIGFAGMAMPLALFNNYVPIFLREFGLSATMIAFVMTWDNYINMFVQPVVGDRSDRTRTRFGRRKPWILVGAPFAALFFAFVPGMPSVTGMMIAIFLTNFSLALFRSPGVALIGDLYPSEQRSLANGIINLSAGLGTALALFAGGWLFREVGREAPFLFGSIIMASTLAILIFFIREPDAPQPPVEEKAAGGLPENLKAIWRDSDRSARWILLAIICWFMGFTALEALLSLFGKTELGIDAGRTSQLIAALALTFVLCAVPSGLLAMRFGRRRVIMTGIAGLTLLLLYGFTIRSEMMFLAFLVPAGAFWALINVNSLPALFDAGGNTRIGSLTGLYYFASSLAAVAGPQVAGFLIDLAGDNYRLIFLYSAFFMAFAGGCIAKMQEPELSGRRDIIS